MPSKQSEAVRRHWAAARLAMVRPDAEQPDDESWGNLTAEPREVDYLETSVETYLETSVDADERALPAMWAVPKHSTEDRVLLCMHGGGYISGSMYTHRKMFAHLAKATGARALIFDYRLAPEHTHPTQVDDATAAYQWLLAQGISADHIALAGDSAGGGLAISAQLRARERGLPLPAAAMLFSPWVDPEATGESYGTNRDRDPFFYQESVRLFAGMFLGEGGDPRDPLANPLFADLSGLGPIYIQVGGDETLLSDARRLDEHARKAGVDVRLDVFPDMPHTFQMAAGRAPEADMAVRAMAEWVRPKLHL
ncbi:alpha/beta hydrolase [Actinopolymorpha pittospori]|uniref:Acetyl esterase/lipase n=1 Tax=Actinopolymorpha pittospori TaxID=648752 RepID=A0A927RE49_9ACTN|nr:alpha/beta hydrolase [Actinopolymorpha pittospori]MBE1608820.1 acetyl esterase/lipase [Actinopolymorpha pittospori]